MKWHNNLLIIIAEAYLAIEAIISILTTGGDALDFGYLGFMCAYLLLSWIRKRIRE